MTDLENKLFKTMKETCGGLPDLYFGLTYYDNVSIKDMTRNELELLCTLLAHWSMLKGK